MIPLSVVMRHELSDRASQRRLADEDHAIEALVFDRAHKSLCVRILVSPELHLVRMFERA
jgi:hypothetical protein